MIQNKTLGKSGIKISPIDFGGSTLADLNTKLDDMYLSSNKDIHIGTKRHLTMSTNKNALNARKA